MGDFERHFAACNNAVLPGERRPFRVGAAVVGWVRPDFARALARLPAVSGGEDGVTLADGAALEGMARALAEAGWYRWRNEAFDVRAAPGGAVLGRVDRGALPAFGLLAEGVSEILTIGQTEIQPTPEVASQAAKDLVSGVIAMDGRMISRIDLDAVFPRDLTAAAA